MWPSQQRVLVRDRGSNERRTCQRSSALDVVSFVTTSPNVLLGRRTRRRSKTNRQHQQKSMEFPPGWRKTLPCLLTYPQESSGVIWCCSPKVLQMGRILEEVDLLNQYLATGAHNILQQDVESSCSQMSGTAVQSWQQCRVSSSADASVTTQILAAVRDSGDRCIILAMVDLVFRILLSCSCSNNRWRGSCSGYVVLATIQQSQQQHLVRAYLITGDRLN